MKQKNIQKLNVLKRMLGKRNTARSYCPEVGNDHLKPADHSNNASCCIEELQKENSFVLS